MKFTKEQIHALWKIIVGAALFAVICFLPIKNVAQAAAFAVPYLLLSYDVLWDALRSIFHKQLLDEKFLMSIATVSAFAIREYKEAVAVMLFYKIGEWLEEAAVGKSRRSIQALLQLRADHATMLVNGIEKNVSPQEVPVGAEILVRPGERIPLDGIIISGETTVDTSALTGESTPIHAANPDTVLGGTINLSALIYVRVTKPFAQSTMCKILELVENASAKKTHTEAFITRFSRIYTPLVVGAAVLLACIPPLIFQEPFVKWLERALLLLIVSCPCALVVSVPLGFFCGIGCASRHGILIKGSGFLEQLAKLKICVFDKTGTLTQGTFTLCALCPRNGSETELLALAAALEANSNHPIARCIAQAGAKLQLPQIERMAETPGRGVCGILNETFVLAGSSTWIEEHGIMVPPCQHNDATAVHVAYGKSYLGYLVVADQEREQAAHALFALRKMGVQRLIMLSGDRESVARAMATRLGLDEYHAQLLPDEKVAWVERLSMPEGSIAFVGDGINDAPVLSRADIGVAMGALGSDAALEAADIVLMQDRLYALPLAVAISRKTKRIVTENVGFALAVKACVILLGAIGLIDMWIAVFADVGVLCLTICNAMRAFHVPADTNTSLLQQ